MEAGAHNPKPKVIGGKGKGGSTQRNVGKRKADVDTPKLPCLNWTLGNDFCKHTEACRYSHAEPKGGGGSIKTTLATTVKRAKKNKVKFNTVVVVTGDDNNNRRSTKKKGTRSWENESVVVSDHL